MYAIPSTSCAPPSAISAIPIVFPEFIKTTTLEHVSLAASITESSSSESASGSAPVFSPAEFIAEPGAYVFDSPPGRANTHIAVVFSLSIDDFQSADTPSSVNLSGEISLIMKSCISPTDVV